MKHTVGTVRMSEWGCGVSKNSFFLRDVQGSMCANTLVKVMFFSAVFLYKPST